MFCEFPDLASLNTQGGRVCEMHRLVKKWVEISVHHRIMLFISTRTAHRFPAQWAWGSWTFWWRIWYWQTVYTCDWQTRGLTGSHSVEASVAAVNLCLVYKSRFWNLPVRQGTTDVKFKLKCFFGQFTQTQWIGWLSCLASSNQRLYGRWWNL